MVPLFYSVKQRLTYVKTSYKPKPIIFVKN